MESEDEAAVDAPDEIGYEDSNANDNKGEPLHGSHKLRLRQRNDCYVAAGVYTDFENLLKEFLAKETSTFEDFVAIWQEKKFSLIFNGRDSHAELLEFSEEVLTIAKSFILPPHPQIKRIGALYLMYGLYSQQPYRDTVKFRVTPQEWSIILKFVENLKAHGFIDANYIFHKMCLDGAFLTVAYNREYGLERTYRKYMIPWQARDKELEPGVTFSLETLMGRVYRGSLKSATDKLRTKYNNIKKILRGKEDGNFRSLKGTEKAPEEVMLENMYCAVDGTVEGLGDTKKCSRLGGDRRSIVHKAFTIKGQQKASQCSLLLEAADSSEASTSHENSEATGPPKEDILEDKSASEESDFELVMKPRSSRTKKARTSRRRKSKKQEQAPSLKVRGKQGPKKYDICYAELKPTPIHEKSDVNQKEASTRTEEVEETDCYLESESPLVIDLDGPPQATKKGRKKAKLKSPSSAKSRSVQKQDSPMAPLPLCNEAESSITVMDLPSLLDTTTTVQLKNSARKRSDFITDSDPDMSENIVEISENKTVRSTRRSRKSGGVLNFNDSETTQPFDNNAVSQTMPVEPKRAKLKSPCVRKGTEKGKQGSFVAVSALDNQAESSSSVKEELPSVSDTTTTFQTIKRGKRKSGAVKDLTSTLSEKDSCPSSEIPKEETKKSTKISSALDTSENNSQALSPQDNSNRRSRRRTKSRSDTS